jgi:hypothetical protein
VQEALEARQRYRNEVWLVMHNSENPENETAAVRLYLDESGTRDPGTPQAVVGGLIINYSHFLHFEEAWDEMLNSFQIAPPLHMKEFGRHGRLGTISPHCRGRLFSTVAELVNSHKIASISASVTNAEYEAEMPPEARQVYSVYAMCFCMAMVMNHKLAQAAHYSKKVQFVLDTGNPYAEHARQAHATMLAMQNDKVGGLGFVNAGGLSFQDDADLGVLQAADVIAWGARRMASNTAFPPGMEPIADILAVEQAHHAADYIREWLKLLGASLKSDIEARRKDTDIEEDEF